MVMVYNELLNFAGVIAAYGNAGISGDAWYGLLDIHVDHGFTLTNFNDCIRTAVPE